MKEPENLNNSLYFLTLALKSLALYPVSAYGKNGGLRVSNNWFAYSVVAGSLLVGVFGFTAYQMKEHSSAKISAISNVTFWFDSYIDVLVYASAIVSNWINAKRLVGFLQRIQKIDKYLSRMGPKLSYAPVRKFVTIGLLCIALEFLVTTLLDLQTVEESRTLHMVTSYFTIVTSGLVKLQYASAVFLIKQRFKKLNQNLQLLETNTPAVPVFMYAMDFSKLLQNSRVHVNVKATRVSQIHQIHNKVCDLCHHVNRLFGVHALTTVAIAINVTITEFYYCYHVIYTRTHLGGDTILDLYRSVQWGLVQLVELVGVVHLCSGVQKEKRKTIELLHIIQNHTTDNKELLEAIKLFCLHDRHKDVKFSACGLLSMDYSLLQMVLGAITSYIVIMIQYDMAMHCNI